MPNRHSMSIGEVIYFFGQFPLVKQRQLPYMPG